MSNASIYCLWHRSVADDFTCRTAPPPRQQKRREKKRRKVEYVTHTETHTHTHARTHAHTHTHTHKYIIISVTLSGINNNSNKNERYPTPNLRLLPKNENKTYYVRAYRGSERFCPTCLLAAAPGRQLPNMAFHVR